MTEIDPMLTSHKLNVIPLAKPVRQKVRRFHSNRHQIIQTEVDNLLKASFIREIKYPKWLANVVVVTPQKYPIIFIIILLYIPGMNWAKLRFFLEN